MTGRRHQTRFAKLATFCAVVCGALALSASGAEGTHSVTSASLDCANDQLIPPTVEDSTFFAGVYAIPYFLVTYPDGSQHWITGYWIAEYESAYGFPNLYAWGYFPTAESVVAYPLPRTVPIGSTYAAGWWVWSAADAKAGLYDPWVWVWAKQSAGGYYCSNAFQ